MTREQVNKLEEGDLIRYKGIPWQFDYRCANDTHVRISSLRDANRWDFVSIVLIEEFEPFEEIYFTPIR